MWCGTNFDYEDELVTDVFGPYPSKAEAVQAIRAHAESEFEVLKTSWDDAKIFDELEKDDTIEVTFDDDNENGCLYQVVKLTPKP